jgi:hypothetical protein
VVLQAAVAAPFARPVEPVAAQAVLTAAPAGAPAAAPMLCQLADFAIAGGNHHGLAAMLGDLVAGDVLRLIREPDNPHDPNAVAVHHASGLKLGYVPRDLSALAAELLDDGIPVQAEVVGALFADRLDPLTMAMLRFTSFQDGDPHIRLLADDALLAARIERVTTEWFTRLDAAAASTEQPVGVIGDARQPVD